MKINEVFQTIQGEATHTGRPSVFVRTQFCPVGCPWCDTKHTWADTEKTRVAGASMMGKVTDSDQWAEMEPLALLSELEQRFQARHLVLTGGEPMFQADLPLLCELALQHGWTVQIETSGVVWSPIPHEVWVTLSPKINMPGGYDVLEDLVRRADEIKMPVGKAADVQKLLTFLSRHNVSPKKKPIWLQPLSQSSAATRTCVEAATALGYRVSIQTHKFIGVR
jgi:7-carboxy-7-deazaguanine synthase